MVETKYGQIIGTYNETVDRKVVYEAYRGIPYAEPPIGDFRFAVSNFVSFLDTSIVNLRFQPPIPHKPWVGYWDGTHEGNVCVQGSEDNIRGSEDCLVLNVYAPKVIRYRNNCLIS